MTPEEYLEQFKRKVLEMSDLNGSFYIAQDGGFIIVPSHSSVADALYRNGIELEEGLDYSEVLFDRGYIRGNTYEPRYVQLTKTEPTKEQQTSLLAVFGAMEGSLYLELPDQSSIRVCKCDPEVILGVVLSMYKKREDR